MQKIEQVPIETQQNEFQMDAEQAQIRESISISPSKLSFLALQGSIEQEIENFMIESPVRFET